ncbi:uncharacterized protein LOC121803896 [Salvia splendens]|uniref:uncharacterized protein LOC121803896 n=1 Tax=Salvia splendens TaxID=180675 RepID=UPI001C27E161|nr:uncharacterized protein LOC121803896 [Salvia splendens]
MQRHDDEDARRVEHCNMVEVVDDCVREVAQAISPQDQLKRCLSQSIFSPYYTDITEPNTDLLNFVGALNSAEEVPRFRQKFLPLRDPNEEEKEEKKEELKPLPSHLKYAFLGENATYLVIVSSSLTTNELDKLLRVLWKHMGAIGWSISDLKGISPTVCMHRILLEEGYKPKAQNQRRPNPIMQDVVRKEVLKWLDPRIIYYAISDSDWVSPTQVVAKKGGMTVVKGGDDEMIATRLVTGWRILIAPEDQYKSAFICPYGVYAYKRMSFGLCNAPATFQRCMMSIFHDMVDDIMEVFMDNFSVFGSSFDHCLGNLTRVWQICEETNLVLNWEKCHFMAFETLKKALVSALVLISSD